MYSSGLCAVLCCAQPARPCAAAKAAPVLLRGACGRHPPAHGCHCGGPGNSANHTGVRGGSCVPLGEAIISELHNSLLAGGSVYHALLAPRDTFPFTICGPLAEADTFIVNSQKLQHCQHVLLSTHNGRLCLACLSFKEKEKDQLRKWRITPSVD
eukprot:1161244-Pelagomonas_calceolata.AAC.10